MTEYKIIHLFLEIQSAIAVIVFGVIGAMT